MNRESGKPPNGMPLKDVTARELTRYESGVEWYRVVAPGKITAEIVHPDDAFLCRLDPPKGEDIVQLSIGRVRSLVADALFSPKEDLGLKFDGSNIRLEWSQKRGCYLVRSEGDLTVHVRKNVYRDGHGLKWYEPMDRSVFKRAPSGWCSWYIYDFAVDEKVVLEHLAWLRDHLARFGLEYLQVDDGWQGRGQGGGSNRDWFTTCERKFPRGMKWLAEEIRRAGLIPGIWIIPFTQSNPEFYEENRDWFVQDRSGRSIGELKPSLQRNVPPDDRHLEWIGRYILDPTSKKGQDYLRDLLRMLCDEWGYAYIKTDGQGFMAGIYNANRECLADPTMRGDEAYRAGLSAMREGMGKKCFLLSCAMAWDSAGLSEGIRVGPDIEVSVDGLERAVDCTMRHLYLNSIVWWTDPDCVCVRPPLTFEEARVWVTMVGITGQQLMTSDDMPNLTSDRVELLKRIIPVAEIRPMELYPLRDRPGIFDLKINKPGVGEWDVVAVFNWNRTGTRESVISTDALGIPPSRRGFVFYDVYQERILGTGVDTVNISVPPLDCRVVNIRHLQDHPQIVATSRHLTQGADDLEKVRWSTKTSRLSGRSHVVGGDPYHIRFTVPEGWDVATEGVKVENGIGVFTLQADRNETINWSISFRR